MNRILVTGAGGQIGSELVPALRARYGDANVMATDIRTPKPELLDGGPFQTLDVTDPQALGAAAVRHRVDTIYHLASILSAAAERDPRLAYHVNMNGLYSVLEVSREQKCALFVPSSIAAFGPTTPPNPAPQDTIQRPTSIYGVTKVAGELLCDYYHMRFGVDARGVRYPGLISYGAPPGGGTTDYAVDIYCKAIEQGRYTCFLAPGTQLDMMYMPDALRAAIELMEADPSRLIHRNAFNVTAMQLFPERIADAIRRHIPSFELSFVVDPVRQGIAESWPRSIDDSAARDEWGWKAEYDLEAMTADMLTQLRKQLTPVEPSAS